MAKQRTSFAKLQRDRAKQARKAEKQAKVQGKSDVDWDGPSSTSSSVVEAPVERTASVSALFEGRGELSAQELLEMIEQIHQMKASGAISEDEFEEAKIEIFTRLPDA